MSQTMSTNPYTNIWGKVTPWVAIPLQGLGRAFMYIVCFRFLVTFSTWGYAIGTNFVEAFRKAVLAAGKVAESAFIAGTFYVLCYTVAKPMLTSWLGQDALENTNHFVLIVFCALPELILLDAITISVERIVKFFQLLRDKEEYGVSLTWAILTSIPTIFFMVLTVYTISMYVGSSDHNFDMVQLTGFALLFRVLPGWCYAIVNGLYEKFGRNQFDAYINQLKQSTVDREATIKERDAKIDERDNAVKTLVEANDSLYQNVDALQARLYDVERQLSIALARKQVRKQTVPSTQSVSENEQAEKLSSSQDAASSPAVQSESKPSTASASVLAVDAAELLRVKLPVVSRLVNSKVLKNAPNSTRITLASIEKYAQRKNINLKKERNTDALTPVVNNGHNGHSNQPADITELTPVSTSNGHSNQPIDTTELTSVNA